MKSSFLLAILMCAFLLMGCGAQSDDSTTHGESVAVNARQARPVQKDATGTVNPGSYGTVTQALYLSYFGRPADANGLANFEAALAAAGAPADVQGLSTAYATNPTIKSLVDSFGHSAESTALYGTGATSQFVTAIFQNVLGRVPAQSGLTFWTNAIDTGAVTMGDAALSIMAGALANTTTQGLSDAQLINNRITVAADFTAAMTTQAEITSYVGSNAAAIARNMIAGVVANTDVTNDSSSIDGTLTELARAVTPPAAGTLSGNTVLPGSGSYPRVIRLAHGASTTNGTLIATSNYLVYRSMPGGVPANAAPTWTKIGSIPPASTNARCCGTLFEMPQTIGALTAGSLLYAVSDSNNATNSTVHQIDLYVSLYQAGQIPGSTWTYLSTPVASNVPNEGVWEPEFKIATDGGLVMYWSDETAALLSGASQHSQKISQIRTYDGTHWIDQQDTILGAVAADRPGMARVSILPNGNYFLTYEYCGPSGKCNVHSRFSTDGYAYPASTDQTIVTAAGQTMQHAPENAWGKTASANGAIYVVAQDLVNADGSLSPQSGTQLMVSTNPDGASPYTLIPAPVTIPTSIAPPATGYICDNYSSVLLPSVDGSTILEIAGEFVAASTCNAYSAFEYLQ